MNYQPMLPVVDEWVLWLCCLIVPLMALVTLTAFIVFNRNRKTASQGHVRNDLMKASLAAVATFGVLGFMLYSGLRIEENKSIASENMKSKYGVESVLWETPEGKDVSPTDSLAKKYILVKDTNGVDHVAAFNVDGNTSEPFIEYLPVSE